MSVNMISATKINSLDRPASNRVFLSPVLAKASCSEAEMVIACKLVY